jgi:hypothetical protein
MYGQGLGDCFLLAFPRVGEPAGGRPVYVVVDCGVIGGTPGGPERMRQIVDDIRQTTFDDTLDPPRGHVDVLAITHEHWDHVSGFVQAEAEWGQIQVDTIWTAWTEGEDDAGLPDALRKIIQKQKQALDAVANQALRFGLGDQHETLLGLMSFLADDVGAGVPFGTTRGTRAAFDIAKQLAGSHVLCEPGDVRLVPGTETVAYVLGPPRSDARLRQLDPTRADPETYGEHGTARRSVPGAAEAPPESGPRFAPPDRALSLHLVANGRSAFNAFALPLVGMAEAPTDGPPPDPTPATDTGDAASSQTAASIAASERDTYERSFPFDRAQRVPLPLAERAVQAAMAPHAERHLYPALASYFDELHCWRRIDFDWLAGAEAFALQADSLTNNTCLVLAFELPVPEGGGERKVLLFVADAQVGNWLSWDEIEHWQRIDGAQPSQSKPDIPDLMRRTTFYKVGHHGSHNATLKARGVERMRGDHPLTAFVPVSPTVAREIKDWCRMPLDALLDALAERTGERVVLANGNVWPPIDDPAELARARARIGVEVSASTLPPKVRAKDGKEIEGPIPLWVQMAIDY